MNFTKCIYILGLFTLLLAGACGNPATPEESAVWLGEADPNPMRVGESATIAYQVLDGYEASIVIINSLGQEVIFLTLNSGSGSMVWNGLDSHGRRCGEGMYFYTLSSSLFTATRKLRIIK